MAAPNAPRARINYLQDLGQARAADLIQKARQNRAVIDPDTQCWRFIGSKNTDGYGQIYTKRNADLHLTGRGAQKAFLIHRVAYLWKTGMDAVFQGSHLCDQRECFNPDHIVDENVVFNNNRKGCPGPLFCSDHGNLFFDCPHNPRCIRPARDDLRCCLSMKESDPSGWATDPVESQGGASSSDPVGEVKLSSGAVEALAAADHMPSTPPAPPSPPRPRLPRPTAMAELLLQSDPSEYEGADELERAIAAGVSYSDLPDDDDDEEML